MNLKQLLFFVTVFCIFLGALHRPLSKVCNYEDELMLAAHGFGLGYKHLAWLIGFDVDYNAVDKYLTYNNGRCAHDYKSGILILSALAGILTSVVLHVVAWVCFLEWYQTLWRFFGEL